MALRVLLVEDEEATAALFADVIRELGHEPVMVRSAETARQVITVEPVDIILLDLRVPLMSGLDFLQLESVRRLDIPIIAVSGIATEAEARECLQLGALDFLSKPVSIDLLREVLRYAEVRCLAERLDASHGPIERGRSARVPVRLPVRVVEYGGEAWEGTCVELSAFGVRVQPRQATSPGSPVRLVLAPSEGGPALEILAVLVRTEPDGYVFRFVNLSEHDYRRLRDTVRRSTSAAVDG